MKRSWKRYWKKRAACLLCAAMMLGSVPMTGTKAEDVSDTPTWAGVKLQIEGKIDKDASGKDAVVKLSVKNTDAFKDVPSDLQEHIAYHWYVAGNVEDLANDNGNTGGESSYTLKGTDLTNGNAFIQVKASYGGPTGGLSGLDEINGIYPYGESRILEVKDRSLEVDAIADVTVKGSGKDANNGVIEIDHSNNDMEYYYQEHPEDRKQFVNWKLEGLSVDQKIGVSYKEDIVKKTAILNKLYAVYTIPEDASQSSASPSPTAKPEPTDAPVSTPTVTGGPVKVPDTSVAPTGAPASTTDPATKPGNTAKPTKVPENTTDPTKKPGDITDPTGMPENPAEPTKTPGNAIEPTKMPADTAEPAPVDMNKPGTVTTVGNAVYKSNGSNSVSYDGVKTDRKTVSVPDKVTVNGKSYPVTKISSGAFSGSKVQKVNLGKNVKTIGKRAFKNCKSLKKVAFSNKTTTVDSESFSGCAKLGSVSLPATVKTVGAKAFKNCKKLKKFTLGKKSVKMKKGKVMFGAVGGKKVAIGASALENCLNLRSVIINSQVTKIGNNTFKNCKKLASMLVKSLKLKTVGNRALKGVSHCKISVPTIRLKKYRTLFTNKGQGKKVVIAKV